MSRYRDEEEDNEMKTRSWGSYLREEVTVSWGDAVLIVGCFATGLLDSAVFNVWACFVSMQTGESIGLFRTSTTTDVLQIKCELISCR